MEITVQTCVLKKPMVPVVDIYAVVHRVIIFMDAWIPPSIQKVRNIHELRKYLSQSLSTRIHLFNLHTSNFNYC